MQAKHLSHKMIKNFKNAFSYTHLGWGHKHLDHCASCVARDGGLISSAPQYPCFLNQCQCLPYDGAENVTRSYVESTNIGVPGPPLSADHLCQVGLVLLIAL